MVCSRTSTPSETFSSVDHHDDVISTKLTATAASSMDVLSTEMHGQNGHGNQQHSKQQYQIQPNSSNTELWSVARLSLDRSEVVNRIPFYRNEITKHFQVFRHGEST